MLRAKFIKLLTVAALTACSQQPSQAPDTTATSGEPPLRVGVSANYLPIIYKEGGEITGLEADLAKALGVALNRPVEFTELSWHGIFSALDSKQVDIIMSGVSITAERAQHYDFIGPYTTIGQMAIIRLDQAAALGQPGAIYSGEYRIGYVSDTTGEEFAEQSLHSKTQAFEDSDQGISALLNGQIDFFVHDAPAVWQLANAHSNPEYRQKLLGLYHPLTREPLGWVVRKDSYQLKADIEPIFQNWKDTGFIEALVAKWMPTKVLTE